MLGRCGDTLKCLAEHQFLGILSSEPEESPKIKQCLHVPSSCWVEGSVCGCCMCTKLQYRLPRLLGVFGWCLEEVPSGGCQSSTGRFQRSCGQEIWRVVIGRNSVPDMKTNGALFLDFCACHGLVHFPARGH